MSTGSRTSPRRPSTATSTRYGSGSRSTTSARSTTGPPRRWQRAAERLGWSFARINRNWDPAKHDPAMAGYMGFGDLSGAKQSTDRTYLLDAVEHGARIMVGAFVERVLSRTAGRRAWRRCGATRPGRARA